MKDYIRKRVLDICTHILESKHTVRQAAAVFGVSKSTVHKDIPKVNGGKEHFRLRYKLILTV
jgi:DeoR/GlpR family transcriptional regulator of sugar metabolism